MSKNKETKNNIQGEEELKALTVQIPLRLHMNIKTLASSRGLKIKELVMELFEEELSKSKTK